MKVERLYHLVAINDRTGNKTYLTSYPMEHGAACVNKSKFTTHATRRVQLEEYVGQKIEWGAPE